MPDSRRSPAWWRIAVVSVVVGAVLATLASASAAGVLWNIGRVGGPDNASGVVIAVVDTGVDATHPAFGGRVLPQLDFTGHPQTGDPEGHGTHVAGTAAGGSIDCGDGPVSIGVAPDAAILPIRVLDADGSGAVSNVVKGIRAAADRGAAVINLSLGGDLSFLDGGGTDFRDAITYAWSKGSIPVLAAGNSGLLGGIFGSGYGDLDAVVVTATTNADVKAGYASSVGTAQWGIAAPGGDGSGTKETDVLSAYPDQRCALLAGTSMAAPHVSGALAVLRARGLSPQQAVDRVLRTATDVGAASVYGAGLLDLRAATAGLDPTPSSSSTSTTQHSSTSTTRTRAPSSTASGAPSDTRGRGSVGTVPAPTSDPAPSSATTSTSTVGSPTSTTVEREGTLAAPPEPAGGTGHGADPNGPLTVFAALCCAAAWLAVAASRRHL